MGVAGNKSDMLDKQEVTETEALEYCKEIGAEFGVVSACTGHGVQDFFYNVIEKCYHAYEQLDPNQIESQGFITLGERKKKEKKCC